jgi:retron-type reverse transcriptase
MKRHTGLFDRCIHWENLLRAAKNARHGKTVRPVVERFEFRREWELLRLQRDLLAGQYRPGPFTTHRITVPKPRLISAAPYRDRVLHHAVMNVLEPILDRHFHPNNFACRKGKGTHAASRTLQALMRRHAYTLQCDVRQFFPSIDHAILKHIFRQLIKDQRLLDLLDVIVDGSNEQDPVQNYFPGDDLFTPVERRRGLPIGNLTSQWFANWYLNGFDHALSSQLQIGGYLRYCDDFVLLDNDRVRLMDFRDRIEEMLAGLRLRLHPGKTAIVPSRAGITFVGYRIWPARRTVRGSNVRDFLKRLRRFHKALAAGEISRETFVARIQGWFGHATQAKDIRLMERMVDRVLNGM